MFGRSLVSEEFIMQPRHIAIIAAVAAAWGTHGFAAAQAAQAGTTPAQSSRAPSHASRSPGADDRRFMHSAAEAGHFEVIAGEMALARAHDPAVRDYGRRLMQDHMDANRKLERIAMNFGAQLPSRPTRQQLNLVQRLRGLRGEAFDRTFMDEVGVQSHERAIALFRDEANSSSAHPALQHYARQNLPALQMHLRTAQDLQARVGEPQRVAASAASPRTGSHADAGVTAPASSADADASREASAQVQEAVQVVQRMKSDPEMARLLQRAQGVFILPDYGRAALGVGVQGGKGLLVTRNRGDFGNPVFYRLGGVSFGAQVGAAAGQLALLLMTDRAVQQFRSEGNFSINADAGLTIASYSARGQVSGGKVSDVVVWSGTKGLYAGVSAGLTDVSLDRGANRAYYGRRDADANAILSGRLENPHNNVLGMVLGV